MIFNLFQLSASLPLFGGGLSLLPLTNLSRWTKIWKSSRVCWKQSYIFVISSWNTADSLFQLNGFLQMFAAFSNYRQLFPAVECLPAVDSKFPAVDSKIRSFNKFSHARVTSVNSQQKEWVTDKAIQWSKLSKIWPENSAIFPIALEQGQRRDQAQFGGNSGIFARLDLNKILSLFP